MNEFKLNYISVETYENIRIIDGLKVIMVLKSSIGVLQPVPHVYPRYLLLYMCKGGDRPTAAADVCKAGIPILVRQIHNSIVVFEK